MKITRILKVYFWTKYSIFKGNVNKYFLEHLLKNISVKKNWKLFDVYFKNVKCKFFYSTYFCSLNDLIFKYTFWCHNFFFTIYINKPEIIIEVTFLYFTPILLICTLELDLFISVNITQMIKYLENIKYVGVFVWIHNIEMTLTLFK